MAVHRNILVFSLVLLAPILAGIARTSTAATIAAGGYHTCAIGEAAGEMRCWGSGSYGKLANGSGPELDRAAPVAISSPIARWRSVAVGDSHACAIAASGAVYCWGYNGFGQLGDGTSITRPAPVAVVGLGSGVAQLSVGLNHSCALMHSGKVNCWGAGEFGRLGSGQVANQTTPGEVLTLTGAISVGAGAYHTCAAINDGSVKCWGRNGSGQIGDGSAVNRLTPVFTSITIAATEVAIGGYHGCARSAAGAVQCWGYNADGELGNGTTATSTVAVNVEGLASGATRLAAGIYHSCALTAGDILKCWGYNGYGQIGDGATGPAVVRPTSVVNLPIPVAEVTAGNDHTCVRASGNRIQCWGRALHGRTGVGNTATSPGYAQRPLAVSGLPAPAVKLSLRTNNACAVTVIGSASCWGNNESGQIGDGLALPHATFVYQAGPRDVADLSSGVRDIATGDLHACALKTNGTVWCWGSNIYGQLGDQTAIARRTPVQVIGIVNAVQIAAGIGFSCARTAVGGVWCWGFNTNGQLGNGTNTHSLQAVPAIGLGQDIVDLSLGNAFACAVRNDGKVLCWGSNTRGQLGDGTATARNVPTLVNDNFGIYAGIATGGEFSCGLTSAGQAKCWGYNDVGQLGDGSLMQRSTPAGVATLSSGVARLAAGQYHACALLSSGQLKCWGYNANYQLGDGTLVNRTQPVPAANVSGSIHSLALSGQSSCVVLADESSRCWGLNSAGQLGNGSIAANFAVPQEIAQWLRDDLIFRDDFEP
ncbi:alpha-tubulin suppressor-like RCC1 family protein [Tahibacter aquaticus]|uniref:Alpha-tubulin suppressor-like RCC1 family protein n=1 Tax=Tahibacter aquaticus TaxID=520092 RepID=A0A4V3DMU3_9GAMM|nr:RCC1 repeat-containing protein [Tahibacter aquaticus]TDR45926.1 alpha-tubulin suppressor-like RCC1 family protein [Tahibacter aquaticus]